MFSDDLKPFGKRTMTNTPDRPLKNDSRAEGGRVRPPRDSSERLPTYVKHRRRRSGEVVTRSASIQAHCRECVGWDSGGLGSVAEAVRRCQARECWLWVYRNGRLDRDGEK